MEVGTESIACRVGPWTTLAMRVRETERERRDGEKRERIMQSAFPSRSRRRSPLPSVCFFVQCFELPEISPEFRRKQNNMTAECAALSVCPYGGADFLACVSYPSESFSSELPQLSTVPKSRATSGLRASSFVASALSASAAALTKSSHFQRMQSHGQSIANQTSTTTTTSPALFAASASERGGGVDAQAPLPVGRRTEECCKECLSLVYGLPTEEEGADAEEALGGGFFRREDAERPASMALSCVCSKAGSAAGSAVDEYEALQGNARSPRCLSQLQAPPLVATTLLGSLSALACEAAPSPFPSRESHGRQPQPPRAEADDEQRPADGFCIRVSPEVGAASRWKEALRSPPAAAQRSSSSETLKLKTTAPTEAAKKGEFPVSTRRGLSRDGFYASQTEARKEEDGGQGAEEASSSSKPPLFSEAATHATSLPSALLQGGRKYLRSSSGLAQQLSPRSASAARASQCRGAAAPDTEKNSAASASAPPPAAASLDAQLREQEAHLREFTKRLAAALESNAALKPLLERSGWSEEELLEVERLFENVLPQRAYHPDFTAKTGGLRCGRRPPS